MNKYRIRAYLFLLIGAAISGIAGPVIKLTLTKLPTNIFLLYRFSVSSIAIILFLPFVKIRIPKKPQVLANFLLYGFLNSTVVLGLLFWGTSKTSLLDMSLLSVFGPIMSIFAGYVWLHDHVTKQEKLGIILAFLGSSVILVEPFLKHGDGIGQTSGNILIFVCLVVGSVSAVLAKKLLRLGVDPWSLTSISFIIGFISFLFINITQNNIINSIHIIQNLPTIYHLGVFYMALLSGTLAYFLGNLAQKSIEVSEAAIFAYITPALSAILAIFLLGEKFTTVIIAGSLLTILGVIIAETRKRMV